MSDELVPMPPDAPPLRPLSSLHELDPAIWKAGAEVGRQLLWLMAQEQEGFAEMDEETCLIGSVNICHQILEPLRRAMNTYATRKLPPRLRFSRKALNDWARGHAMPTLESGRWRQRAPKWAEQTATVGILLGKAIPPDLVTVIAEDLAMTIDILTRAKSAQGAVLDEAV